MKKILITIIFIILPLITFAQLSGSGTYASPYIGTFQGDFQWNFTNFPDGKVYINGDVTIDDELLTIEAGMSIIFIAEGADLIITNSGQLEAVGSSGNEITFTSDDDNDGIYGETGERWGHIVFWNMDGSTGNSTLEYCTIEWGDVSGTSNTTTYGGGVFIRSFSGLSITNCRISNNKATHGGGIRALKDGINPASSPTITNSLISQNNATISGGGILLDNDCASTISNSIINNNSSGVGGGGGIFLNACSNVRVINSNFTKNTTTRTDGGRNIQYYYISSSTNRPKFINCIAWGDDNSIAYINTSRIATDLTNCAIQDVSTPASLYTSCIDMNATNGAPTGPNFLDPDLPGLDWSITFLSPCRDAGTTPSPTVPNDYIGNSRIGPYDIGAYEVQYSRWRTDASAPTSWTITGNWEQGFEPGHSGTTGDVVIPYLANDTYAPNVSSHENPTSRYLILNPGAKASLGSLTNNGFLRLESNASNISSLITTSFSGNAANVQLYLTGGWVKPPPYNEGRWHYISSPFSAPLLITPFTNETLDLAHWVDGINSEGSIIPGWVAYDRFVYDVVVQPSPLPAGFTHLDPGKGYNFWDDKSSNTYNLSGQLNTADVVVNLAFAGDPIYQGFNLLGNPFPAGLDWDFIINNTTFPDNTGQGIYFTHENVQYSYVSGVETPLFGEPVSSGIIPPMQGFFVKTHGSGNSITLAAGAQVHSAPNRYKGSVAIPLIRLSLTEDSVSGDETVVRFDEKALTSLDNNFDALKMFLSPAKTAIYSILGTTKYSINGQPFPDTFVEIPITINIHNSGNQIIKASRIDYLDNYTITLKDNSTGFTADLRTSPELSFFADAPGTITGRFILKVSNVLTATEELPISANTFNVYSGNNMINIQTLSDDWEGKSGSVKIMDLSGRIFNTLPNAEFRKGSLIQIGATAAKGMYVVEIRSGVKRYVGKVVVR